MYERCWECERKRARETLTPLVEQGLWRITTTSGSLCFISITDTRPCISTEMECEWCLFGHGSKPDGKVWVMAALGDDIMSIHTRTHTCACDRQYYRLTGKGAHATLASECRVLPSSVPCSGLVVGTKHAHMRKLTGKHLCLKHR